MDENVQSKTAFFKATHFLKSRNDSSVSIKSYFEEHTGWVVSRYGIQQSQYKSTKFVFTLEAAHSKALHFTC